MCSLQRGREGGSGDGGGFPDDVVGGLTSRSATSLLDYGFGLCLHLPGGGKKTGLTFNPLWHSCDLLEWEPILWAFAGWTVAGKSVKSMTRDRESLLLLFSESQLPCCAHMLMGKVRHLGFPSQLLNCVHLDFILAENLTDKTNNK